MMEGLAKEIQERMERVGVKGSHVTLKIKQRKQGAKPPPKFLGHGSCHNLSKSTDTAGCTPTQDWNTIAHVSMALFKQLVIPLDDIRGMGIVMSKLVGDKAKLVDSESSSSRITSFFGGEPTGKPAEHVSSHAAEVSGRHEIDNPKSVASFAGAKFLDPTTSFTAERRSIANPTLSQVDMNVLASFPLDIRNEIEDQLGCSCYSTCVDPEESSIGQQESLNVSSQLHCDDSSPTMFAPQNASFEWHGDDLALPPFSQIHMSQVAELPSPLRKKIIAKVMMTRPTKDQVNLAQDEPVEKSLQSGGANARVADRRTGSKHARVDHDGLGMRQLSVKRMLKLAAVKSGQDTDLSTRLGGSVSLTQLECLPLEIQLQVANDEDIDCPSRTASSPPLKARRSIGSESRLRVSSSPVSNAANELKVSRDREGVVSTQASTDYTVPSISQMPSFYHENIRPLKEYMDSNPDLSDESLQKVRDFLCIVVTERRFVDAVKLLRSIKNRGDEWSGHVYQAIRSAVDERTKEVLGRPLDLQGLDL
jgi:DNA repair protein REV1